ncbi:MAG TPA: hemolysin family protein [Candidatus Angelobacter sp.]|nr:hemolysin family protein [Candidatus Angelobacter sp.]
MIGADGAATTALPVGVALAAVVVLIAINALCVFNEFALVALSPTRVSALAESKSALPRMLARQAHQLDNYIAADQLGITISSIAAGWIGQPAVSRFLARPVEAIGLPEAVSAPLIAGITAFTLITATQMVLGELVPKSISLRHAERVGLLIVVPVEVMAFVLRPLTLALNGVGRAILRPFGIDAGMASHHQALGVEDLAGAISSSAEAGLLPVNPQTIENAIRFGELTARDVMVPRRNVIGVRADDGLDEVLDTMRRTRHMRYPVLGDGDAVAGYIHLADLAGLLADPAEAEDATNGGWQALVRPLIAVPELASLESVLSQLRGAEQQMALVVDEFGSSQGYLGLGDLMRGLVDPPRQVTSQRLMRGPISASTPIRDLDEELADALAGVDPQADTLNGAVTAALGRVPRAGDTLRLGSIRIRVTHASDVRAEMLEITTEDASD